MSKHISTKAARAVLREQVRLEEHPDFEAENVNDLIAAMHAKDREYQKAKRWQRKPHARPTRIKK